MRRLVNFGSRCIETEVVGTGKKTVVILPGMNCPIDDWNEVIRAVSRDCRVIAFNRAGCGSSEPNPDGPSVLNTVAEISQEIDTRLTPHQLTLPSNVQQRIIEFSTNPVLYSTMVKEVEIWRQCAQETKTAEPFPEVPLKVIARDPQYSMKLMAQDGIPVSEAELFELTWNKLLVEQAELSPRGELIIAEHSGHSVHEYRPDIIIDAIRNVLRSKMC